MSEQASPARRGTLFHQVCSAVSAVSIGFAAVLNVLALASWPSPLSIAYFIAALVLGAVANVLMCILEAKLLKLLAFYLATRNFIAIAAPLVMIQNLNAVWGLVDVIDVLFYFYTLRLSMEELAKSGRCEKSGLDFV